MSLYNLSVPNKYTLFINNLSVTEYLQTIGFQSNSATIINDLNVDTIYVNNETATNVNIINDLTTTNANITNDLTVNNLIITNDLELNNLTILNDLQTEDFLMYGDMLSQGDIDTATFRARISAEASTILCYNDINTEAINSSVANTEQLNITSENPYSLYSFTTAAYILNISSVLTAQQVMNTIIIQGTPSGDIVYTLPTATSIFNLNPNLVVGSCFKFNITTTGTTNHQITLFPSLDGSFIPSPEFTSGWTITSNAGRVGGKDIYCIVVSTNSTPNILLY